MVRFVHTGDWQLGMTRYFLGPEAQPRFTADRVAAVARIGRLAVEQGCSFVVVSGDVFESNHVERCIVARALDAMAATPEVTFYLLPGNHDPFDAASVFRSASFTSRCPANVVVLHQPGPHPIGPGVELVAAPWSTKRPAEDLLAAALHGLPADGTVRIAVGHGATDVRSPATADPALVGLDALEAAIAEGRVHYVALGDRHSTSSEGGTDRVWYAGTPEPTDYREEDPGNVLVVEIGEGGAVSVAPHRVGDWRFVARTAVLRSAADVAHLDRDLADLPDKARTVLKLKLQGQLSLLDRARLEGVLEHHGELLGSLTHEGLGTTLLVEPQEGELDRLGLQGYAAETLADLRAAATADRSPEATDALVLLCRLAAPEAGAA